MANDAGGTMSREVAVTTPNASVSDVAHLLALPHLLALHGMSAVSVCDDDARLLGVVSEGDLLRPFQHQHNLAQSVARPSGRRFNPRARVSGRRAMTAIRPRI